MSAENIWQYIQSNIEKHPDALALSAMDRNLSFQALQTEVLAYANYLQSQGVKQGDRIALLMARDSHLIIAMLGVLAVGATYVPLYSRYPKTRNQTIINDSGCRFLISTENYEAVQMLATCVTAADFSSKADSLPVINSSDLAYIIYTSGSTGKPKGVMISHANAISMIEWALTEFNKDSLSYTLASTSICFDLSIFEIFVPLMAGGCVVLVDNAFSLIDRTPLQPITLINTVPSAIRELMAHDAIPASVRIINLAGEALEQDLVNKLYDKTKVKSIYNLYGPSETTTYSTYQLVKKCNDKVMAPIGKAIQGTQIYLLDQHQQPVPPLARGEIYIAGHGVTQGYCQRPEETAQNYINLTVAGKTIKAYRTGDFARLNHNNEYEYLGRGDQQIKIHGFRVELDEITKALQLQPSVKQAYVMGYLPAAGEQELIGYIVFNNDEKTSIDEIRTELSKSLPDYMIPHYFIVLTEMPLNTNGKVDRHALPLPQQTTPQQQPSDYQSDLEKEIAQYWQELLPNSSFGRLTNFFYVGGHSLLAARLLAKFKSQYKIEYPLEEVFQYPTIAEQAKKISEYLQQNNTQAMNFTKLERPNEIPLSYSQQRLWYLQHAEGKTPISNIPIVIKIQGKLDISALESSINRVIERHEILRTVYESVNFHIVQRIRDHAEFRLAIETLANKTDLDSALETEANYPFDLSKDLMIRGKLFVISENESILLMTQHHIASDAWSLNIFMHELSTLYKAFHQNTALPMLPEVLQYADYSCWQRYFLTTKSMKADLDYWKNKLENVPDTIKLPFDRQRGESQTYRGEFYQWELEPEFVSRLKSVANRNQSTLFMVLLAAFDVLLYRYSQQDDFCIGILTANRPFSDLNQTLGFFVNSLATRHQIRSDMTSQDLLRQVRTTVLESLAHQQLPFDKLVEELQLQRQFNRHPLFQVLFSLQNALDTDLTLDGLTLDVKEFDRKIAKFDLTLSMVERGDKLAAIFEYNTDLFNRETIIQMTSHYIQILKSFTRNLFYTVNEIDLLTTEERNNLLVNLNQSFVAFPEQSNLAEQFKEMVVKYPEKIALITADESVTYAELDRQSNQLANILLEYGVISGTPVGMLLPRSIDAIVSMLAIVKAGGFYVPMDPAWPVDRLDFMLRDAKVNLVITKKSTSSQMPASLPTLLIYLDEIREKMESNTLFVNKKAIDPNDTCYVMYTSGSTGKPKGVLTTHKGVIRLVKNANYVNLDSEQHLLQVSPLAFDGSTFDIWGALLNGGTLVLMPDGLPELGKLATYLSSYRITTLFITTQLFNSLVEYKLDSLSTLKQILFGGEVASINHVARFKEAYPACSISNIYGPTECTTYALSYPIANDFDQTKSLPLGYPISNTSVVILSEYNQVCPVGVSGEICLGGPGLAKGYLNQNDLTREKFILNPFIELNTEKIYRTGDIGCYRPNGEIAFMGRVDDQVKLRGYRIELSEIEQALRDIPGILDAVVLLQKPEDILVAYLISAPNAKNDIKSVRQSLSHHLPQYMLPDALQLMDVYPLNSNGKVDKKLLPKWQVAHRSVSGKIELTADNDIATIIHQTWIDVLDDLEVTREENFFEIGGNSLKIVHILDQLQTHFKKKKAILSKLDITALFQYPTVNSLAAYLTVVENDVKKEEPVRKRVNQRDKRKESSMA